MTDPVLRFLVVNTAVSLALALVALASSWARLRPQIVHLLWLAALVKLITPSVVPVPVWPAAPSTAEARPTIDFLEVLPLASGGAPSPAGVPPVVPSQELGPVGGPRVGSITSPPASMRPTRPLRPLGPWLLTLWATGSAAWAGLAVGRMARFHRLLRHAQPMTGTAPQVFVIDAAISPLLWAFFGRARIVVPKALFGALSEREREAILRHERAHFRRRDHWVRWVEFAVLAALWWHPLAWWISRRLRAAEEACCDAEVVADMSDRRPYASALLRTALFLSESSPLPPAATGIGRAASIHHRVQTIMTSPVPRRLSFGASCALLAITALAVLAAPVEKPVPLPDTQPAAEPPDPTPDSAAAQATEAIPEATVPAPTDSPPPPDSPLWAPPPKEPARPFSLGGTDLPRRDTIEAQYLSGYIKVQQAEGRQKAGDPDGARRLYQEALAIFESVRARAPEWQARMVQYRINLVQRQLKLATPALSWIQGTTIVSPIDQTPVGALRVGLKTEILGQSWAMVADRIDMIEPEVTTGRSRTMTFKRGETTLSANAGKSISTHAVTARGRVRVGWGPWLMVADKVELQAATIVCTGNPVLLVDTRHSPSRTLLKGRRLVLNSDDRTLSLVGDAAVLMEKSLHQNDADTAVLELTVASDGTRFGPPRGARRMDLNLSDTALGRERSQLLESWPGEAALEAELAPLLQRTEKSHPPVDPWLPEVDGPRQEPLPKEDTPPKKLPG